jgi:hypothetical protein
MEVNGGFDLEKKREFSHKRRNENEVVTLQNKKNEHLIKSFSKVKADINLFSVESIIRQNINTRSTWSSN